MTNILKKLNSKRKYIDINKNKISTEQTKKN